MAHLQICEAVFVVRVWHPWIRATDSVVQAWRAVRLQFCRAAVDGWHVHLGHLS